MLTNCLQGMEISIVCSYQSTNLDVDVLTLPSSICSVETTIHLWRTLSHLKSKIITLYY